MNLERTSLAVAGQRITPVGKGTSDGHAGLSFHRPLKWRALAPQPQLGQAGLMRTGAGNSVTDNAALTLDRPDACSDPTQGAVIETRVRVVSAEGDRMLVEPVETSGCGACQARPACGIGGLARYLVPARRPVAVTCVHPVRAGEEIVLSVAARELLRASLLAYFLPITLGVVAAGVASAQGLSDATAVIALLAGAGSGLIIARRLGRKRPLLARPFAHPLAKGDIQ